MGSQTRWDQLLQAFLLGAMAVLPAGCVIKTTNLPAVPDVAAPSPPHCEHKIPIELRTASEFRGYGDFLRTIAERTGRFDVKAVDGREGGCADCNYSIIVFEPVDSRKTSANALVGLFILLPAVFRQNHELRAEIRDPRGHVIAIHTEIWEVATWWGSAWSLPLLPLTIETWQAGERAMNEQALAELLGKVSADPVFCREGF
jgi:hypothetical protein